MPAWWRKCQDPIKEETKQICSEDIYQDSSKEKKRSSSKFLVSYEIRNGLVDHTNKEDSRRKQLSFSFFERSSEHEAQKKKEDHQHPRSKNRICDRKVKAEAGTYKHLTTPTNTTG